MTVTASGTNAGPSFAKPFGYDTLARLVGESPTVSGAPRWARAYAYEAAGNRMRTEENAGGSATTVTTLMALEANTNQLLLSTDYAWGGTVLGGYGYGLNDGYDAEGNMTRRVAYDPVGSPTSQRDFEHDRWGRLTRVAEGPLVEETPPPPVSLASYRYDGARRLLERTDAAGNRERHYYSGLQRLLVREKPAGASTWRTKTVYMTKPGLLRGTVAEIKAITWTRGGNWTRVRACITTTT